MMTATTQITADQCEKAASEFYRAGMKYIAALDQSIESRPGRNSELAAPRERVRVMETFLHRLFPDEFADTNSAAE
jgi:hypothetical protein